MKTIACWNVNSINSRLSRAVEFLKRHQPDVLCLQELKCIDEKFPAAAFEAIGYHAAVFGQKTYNGVAIIAKEPIEKVQRGFQDGVEDPAARFIAGTVGKIRIVSVYVPNGQAVGTAAYQYKLEWVGRLRRYLNSCDFASDLVVAGDFNVAPEPRDVHDPAAWEGQVLTSEPERAALREVVELGLEDTFRLHHEQPGAYSWWDYRQLAFPFNKGLRIDLILATPHLAKRCVSANIDRDERKGEKPSDHAPCLAVFS
jgi:exodeoxyribonuclease III